MPRDEANIIYLLNFALDEFNHYKILSQAYALLRPSDRKNIFKMRNIEEAKKLEELREKIRMQSYGPQVVALTEGGGLGMYYGVRNALAEIGTHSRLDELIKEFAEKTIKDEKLHFAYRVRDVLTKVTDEMADRFDQLLQEIFWCKLLERNAQFGYVFSEEELRDLSSKHEAGKTYVLKNLSFLLEAGDAQKD